jgi:hypothetical protein
MLRKEEEEEGKKLKHYRSITSHPILQVVI